MRGGGARAECRRLRLDKGCSYRDYDPATTAHGKCYRHRSDSNYDSDSNSDYEHEYPGADDPSEDHVEPTAV